jgi:hypothetical protein
LPSAEEEAKRRQRIRANDKAVAMYRVQKEREKAQTEKLQQVRRSLAQ